MRAASKKKSVKITVSKTTEERVHFHVRGITLGELLELGLTKHLSRSHSGLIPTMVFLHDKKGRGGSYMIHEEEPRGRSGQGHLTIEGGREDETGGMDAILKAIMELVRRRKP